MLDGPLVMRHAVSGDKHSSAILAKMAMDKDLLIGMIAKKQEKLRDLFIGGGRPAADRNIDELHAEGFCLSALPSGPAGIFGA